jgi:hypothetical protein
MKHDDIAEDKKLIKKAFKMHDTQEHKGSKGARANNQRSSSRGR